jgi:hypothetical protein
LHNLEVSREDLFERLKPKRSGPVTVAVFSNTCGNLIQLYRPR